MYVNGHTWHGSRVATSVNARTAAGRRTVRVVLAAVLHAALLVSFGVVTRHGCVLELRTSVQRETNENTL